MHLLAGDIMDSRGSGRRIVAIDNVDGSGKTSFAAGLAAVVRHRPVVIIHADDFLNPSAVRHARGRHSPEGFWNDTYDYPALREYVLDPLGPEGDGRYSPASYDAARDTSQPAPFRHARPETLVLVEGMFLHRDELAGFWDASMFLDVPFAEAAARMAIRDGSHPDPEHPTMRRYVHGQRLYFHTARPWERASFVIDNSDVTSPRLIQPHAASAVP
ncbi:nucleoside/nucleotide kinase family protein [Arthrobacter sp. TMS1-12-1]